MIFFDVEPDRYGRFGHQAYRLLVAVLAAEAFDAFFIPQTFRYFAFNGNQIIDFSRYYRCKSSIPACQIIYVRNQVDVVGNDKFDLGTVEGFGDFVNIVSHYKNSDGNYLIRLPFDQEPGLLMKYIYQSDRIPSALRQTVCIDTSDQISFDVSIHCRRGDVDPSRHPSWFIADEVYDQLISLLLQFCPGLNIALITQKELRLTNSAKMLSSCNSSLTVFIADDTINSNCELRDLKLLFASKLIIGGQSGFSQIPSLYMSIPYIELYNSHARQHQPHLFKPHLSISTQCIIESLMAPLNSLINIVKSRQVFVKA